MNPLQWNITIIHKLIYILDGLRVSTFLIMTLFWLIQVILDA